ncbi:BREX-1 system adenine-specific DNA-methyltransferase PglX [Thalassorhabdomicrobium marinisediminis]|uniref:site-specific DNA-methyltransferase (adenine-specific) n=1 Tax=Thalassorhabdomicrobium marinisediminis TaxID=2170577 RepID=A0A2T7FTZ8_9RHOB|nr:BREX-1 system adenine-specific DNA-methyltransferase PglX [Thalassorhabdomicrobium marinisediminis]PVA05633.1 BREX-1 system adenine-specific DNA-methyltransferase PglX [Thalassorhabdomicrobium marinisediminis]
MDTNALKKFAQAARNLLIDQVTSKLDLVLDPASPVQREHPAAMKALNAAIARDGKRQVIEQVAYTWFNRFTALRFMDVNGYTTVGVVSPTGDQTRPELLAEAMAGNLPEGAPGSIAALLDGRTPSSDPQAEAYRQLLVHTCNQWHGPMPFLFEEIDDYTELLMPEDLLSQTSILAELRKVMTEDACQDVEIIGWLYQFYISEKKDQVFAGLKKNQKITAENIPAATQLFTPHWIVRYLVENSLGRLWLLNRPGSKLAERMDYYIAPEEPETDFLKIGKPEEIKVCDPACGSGHMLTYAFDLLYAIYEEEGYEADRIPALILTHNLTGVEIDDRAGALAAFALAMKAAARLGRRRFLRMEAKPDIVVLQNVTFTPAEMQDVAAVVGKDLFTDELRETLLQFEQAKNFGSLIVPKLRDPAETLRVVEARDFGGDLLLKEVQERVVSVLRMAEALSPKYHVVVANPPYMGASGMNAPLQDYAKERFPNSKSDLFAMFMERSLWLSRSNAMTAMINMQAWMFQSSYEQLRSKLLSEATILTMAHQGPRGFDTIGGEVVTTTAFVLAKFRDDLFEGSYLRLVDGNSEAEKAAMAQNAIAARDKHYYRAASKDFEKVPGEPIAYWINSFDIFSENPSLADVADLKVGLQTGDNDRFLKQWFEVSSSQTKMFNESVDHYYPYSKGGEFRKWYGNREFVIDWRNDGFEIKNFRDARGKLRSRPQNVGFYFREAAEWSDIGQAKIGSRLRPEGSHFDVVAMSIFARPEVKIEHHLAFLNSTVSDYFADIVVPGMHCNTGYVGKIPFVKAQTDIAAYANQAVSVARSDWDAYETSWDFTTLPLLSPDHRADTLKASYTRLRAHWQAMTDEMQRLEEENNRIFIDAYGLQDELTPEVPIEEITLTCNPAYRYGVKGTEDDRESRLRADTMAEFLSYAVGCMFGRYSLDAPGLILANQGERLEDYLARIPEPSFMPDEDNVIPVLDADWFADDITERFRLFLRVTFGEAHFRENLRYIEDALGKDIRKYFTKDFYADHVKRYKKRPIYWMFSSPKGTFNALIYMHRYRGDTVSVLLNDYLREFISKLEGERGRLEKLSDDPSASQGQRTKALKDMAVIAKQIDELNEWERDVAFPLAQAKIEIDLDDGVKANYPKFGAALKKIPGLEAKDD